MWLKKILNLVPDTKSWSESTLMFETKTTEESTTTIQFDESGKETGRNTVNNVNTEYTINKKSIFGFTINNAIFYLISSWSIKLKIQIPGIH